MECCLSRGGTQTAKAYATGERALDWERNSANWLKRRTREGRDEEGLPWKEEGSDRGGRFFLEPFACL